MSKNMPENWEPPYPSWSADFSQDNDHFVVVYYGLQYRETGTSDDIDQFTSIFDKSCSADYAPQNVERGSVTDVEGYRNDILVCYWPNHALFQKWQNESAFSLWLGKEEREQGDVGYWIERHIVPLNKFETLFSTTDAVGAATLTRNEMVGPIKEHAYWGGMRDRIPLSKKDVFQAEDKKNDQDCTASNGRRVILNAPENLCIIRSGQNWALCKDEERETYLNLVHPDLKEGMDYLRDNPIDSGCLSCRFVTETDQDNNEVQRSFGLAYFVSMKHLEGWSKSHPTHLKIFQNFHRLVEKFNFELDLRLWHEVAILTKENSNFEYINCHDKTGILSF